MDSPLHSLIDDYVDDRFRLRRIGPSARRTVRSSLRNFANWAEEADRQLEQLARQDVEAWIAARRNLEDSTVGHYLVLLGAFFDWLLDKGTIQANPCRGVQAPRLPRLLPRDIPDEDIGRLWAVLPDTRARLIVSLGFNEALRASEVAGLQRPDIDLRELTAFVKGKGGHERIVPVTEDTERVLRCYLAEEPGRFGSLLRSSNDNRRGITGNYVTKLCQRWMQDAGLKQYARDGMSFHVGRHTAATRLYEATNDLALVQELLGHATLNQARKYARRVPRERLRAGMNQRSVLNGTTPPAA